MGFKSEIRDSDVRALEAKAAAGNYGQYLKRIVLKKVRGFVDRDITFDFPVTALVGPNGGGKTTVLGAAALIYRSVAPSRFFAKSGKYDLSMKDWVIEYDLWDRRLNDRIPIQRTASFKSLKWNRKAVNRKVLIFGVTRTVPATERRELSKAAGNKFAAESEVLLGDAVVAEVGRILGKPIAGYTKLTVDKLGRISLLTGQSPAGEQYSEFHFGAGEASVTHMVSEIEAAPDQSLILIEEIENGLHPVATRRMVEYLLDVAKRKACQVIFTTHSNDALDPLPSKGIWAAYNGHVLQGKLDVRALRTITGQIDAKLAIFVEDDFATLMVTTALRYHGGVEMDGIEVHGMGGWSQAIEVNRNHNNDPAVNTPSVCILDGDQSDRANPGDRVFALPGAVSPDAHVFDCVHDVIDAQAPRLTLALYLPLSEKDRVARVVKERGLTNRDRHLVFDQIGEDLDFTAGVTVAQAFLAIWAQVYGGEVQTLVESFIDLVPLKSDAGQEDSTAGPRENPFLRKLQSKNSTAETGTSN